MSGFLDQVAAQTRKRVEGLKRSQPLAALPPRDAKDPVRPLTAALRREALSLIAELKQSSPSAGLIREETDIQGRLAAYERGGAAALSILTEESYFHGSPRWLELARRATRLPVLRKDFIVDPYQILESRSLGADAILLIAAILSDSQMKEFLQAARETRLEALVEVHDEKDLDRVLSAGAALIGVNNRDLRTLAVDVRTAERLVPRIPRQGATIVVESGIKTPGELARIRQWGAHAVLIGETLMRDSDPEAAVRRFVEAGQARNPL